MGTVAGAAFSTAALILHRARKNGGKPPQLPPPPAHAQTTPSRGVPAISPLTEMQAAIDTLKTRVEFLERAEVRAAYQQKEARRHIRELQEAIRTKVETSTFESFTQEQREQWLEINRSLGQIEGMLQGK